MSTEVKTTEEKFNPDEYKTQPETETVTDKITTDSLHSGVGDSDSVASDAPFGLDDAGVPKAPYGYTKDGKIKKISGRPPSSQKGETVSATGAKVKSDAEKLQDDIGATRQTGADTSKTDTRPVEPVQATAPVKPVYEVYVSGAMFLLLIDFLVPNTLAMAYNMVSKDRVAVEDLKMDADDKAEMAKITDAAVKELLSGLSVLQQFMLCITIMYGSKLSFAEKTPKLKMKTKVDNKETEIEIELPNKKSPKPTAHAKKKR